MSLHLPRFVAGLVSASLLLFVAGFAEAQHLSTLQPLPSVTLYSQAPHSDFSATLVLCQGEGIANPTVSDNRTIQGGENVTISNISQGHTICTLKYGKNGEFLTTFTLLNENDSLESATHRPDYDMCQPATGNTSPIWCILSHNPAAGDRYSMAIMQK